jgi:hypothetical protein
MACSIDSTALGYEVVSNTETLSSGSTAPSISVSAPAGKVVVGGGGGGGFSSGFRCSDSRPAMSSGKAVGWVYEGSATPSGPWSLTVWAICVTE